ncbi:MAG: hypothetical protein LBH74_03385 [Nitrososphaerota archaeon]|jgi:hypothetical protein|uniref:hypothetical protein n=1 Tax=Candidatus Bathycorpusculum sp. TaxID=2994959 RepID=UPI00282427DC|nr:hypothetical protein [Candidatus Termitimicrobium sp.]MCL2432090.1 hypothetical protein [Candidatus Termitimicrobium sp.]MDR0492666.1 hypothetical protein [Nitrososphaerota archaeon]
MSEEGDPFWASLYERILGLILIIIGALLLYFTVSSDVGGFSLLFGFLSAVVLLIGILLLVIKPAQ